MPQMPDPEGFYRAVRTIRLGALPAEPIRPDISFTLPKVAQASVV